MLRPSTPTRRGVTLIVVLSLLSLLALVGLAAVYFAKDQAERARIQGQGGGFTDDGTGAATAFLSQFIYGDQDTGQGLLNAARGHSLVATMYGGRVGANPAWSGPGTFAEVVTIGGQAVDRRRLVNHRLFPGMTEVYDPEYSSPAGRPPASPPGSPGFVGTFIGKNPPYTYPDVKDFYLAAVCPATGEVLVPSYHRRNVFGPLDPSNPNWTDAAGKFLTSRPRPQDHPRVGGGGSNFPLVPPNADGTYTGDVQNLPGGFFRDASGATFARNDSIWIDIGLPPITLPTGRRVKPLIAPLILDLDGRLNLSVHGNVLNGGAHASGKGFGPWEVSLEKALGAAYVAEARALVAYRRTALTRGGLTARAFDPRLPAGNQHPAYGPVAWSGFTGPDPLRLPSFAAGNPFATAPLYASGYDVANSPVTGHPALLNPGEWPSGAAAPSPRSFSLADGKVLAAKYAPSRAVTGQLTFATPSTAPQTLVGDPTTYPGPTPNPPAAATPNAFRADVSHPYRQLFATRGAGLDRPGLTPDSGQVQNPLAGLAPANLSRRLADYRADTTAPLSATNAGNAANAAVDRQRFATEIFARLLVAASAPGVAIDVTTGAVSVVAGITPAEINTLRGYAQLAANIVDFIDSDDVSTRFEWYNPGTPEVVYGVEKPRLVLTEAYSEVTNDPADPALGMAMGAPTLGAHVRFWLELQNPSPTLAAGPLGDGSVRVKDGAVLPYRVEIVRDARGGAGTSVLDLLRNPANANNPGNVTGGLGGLTPDVVFDFSLATAAQEVVPAANGAAGGGIVVCAANVPMPPMGSPDFNPMLPTAVAAAAVPAAIGGSTTALSYPLGLADSSSPDLANHVVLLRRLANPYLPEAADNPYVTVDVLGHVRTADRVLRGATDTMNRMARTTAMGAGYEPNTAPAAMTDPDLRPQGYGKVDPFAGFSAANYTFPTSMVLRQEPATVGTGATGVRHTLGRQNSRADAAPAAATFTAPAALTDTLMAPYDWLVHPDRPLVNPLELLLVGAVKPHELTTQFIRGNATNDGLVRHGHTVRQSVLTPSALTPAAPAVSPVVYRALDLLRTQPHGHQAAVGGRVHGRVNVNTIQDRRVWRALFDAQVGNGFDETFVDAMWDELMQTRTRSLATEPPRTDVAGQTYPTPVPGPSVHDTGNPNDDRPVLPLGTATVAAGGYTVPGTGATVFAAGIGLDDTLLRRTPLGPTGTPILSRIPGATHPYLQDEAVRKVLNNVTTVSHTFAVWVTVGYFEVESTTPAPAGSGVPDFVTLGREFYLEAPGDARRKFFGFVDRSSVALQPGADAHATERPFFTTLEEDAVAGATTLDIATASTTGTAGVVYADGFPVEFRDGSRLVLGAGSPQEVVTVSGNPAAVSAGVTRVTLAAPVARSHTAGEGVSNVRPGNPGPQTGFDPNADRYKPVVPLWGKAQ